MNRGDIRWRVLVADDDAAMRRVMEVFFLSRDCEVRLASNGAEAIERLEREAAFDLILTDYSMPFQDGLAVLREARVRCPDTRVLIMTGGLVPEEARREAEALGSQVVSKPVPLAVLKEQLLATRVV